MDHRQGVFARRHVVRQCSDPYKPNAAVFGIDRYQREQRADFIALEKVAEIHERYAELLEREGVSPSVEFPRSQWVQVERWDVFRQAEWQSELEAAHAARLVDRRASSFDSCTCARRAASIVSSITLRFAIYSSPRS